MSGDAATPFAGKVALQTSLPSSSFTQNSSLLSTAYTLPSTTAQVLDELRPLGLPGFSNFHTGFPVARSRHTTTSFATFTVFGTAAIIFSFTSGGNPSLSSHAVNSAAFAKGLLCRSDIFASHSRPIAFFPALKRLTTHDPMLICSLSLRLSFTHWFAHSSNFSPRSFGAFRRVSSSFFVSSGVVPRKFSVCITSLSISRVSLATRSCHTTPRITRSPLTTGLPWPPYSLLGMNSLSHTFLSPSAGNASAMGVVSCETPFRSGPRH